MSKEHRAAQRHRDVPREWLLETILKPESKDTFVIMALGDVMCAYRDEGEE